MKTALQLRCQIRTCEARIEFLTDAIRGGDYPALMHHQAHLHQAHADLAVYRAQLSTAALPSASCALQNRGDSSAIAEQAALPSKNF